MSDKSSKAAYIYALMANCLQFHKESEENLAMAGTSITRSILCELLAVKLLKEFTSRELVSLKPGELRYLRTRTNVYCRLTP
jgi:hypothetical protein